MVKSSSEEPVNILFGPPRNTEDQARVLSLFFSCSGRHIVCGGTTASLVAAYLKKPLVPTLCYEDADVPPIAEIEGVDLVTEGIVTMQRVVFYAEDYIADGRYTDAWRRSEDGASRICRMLFENGADVHVFFGKAVNPAHQALHSPIRYQEKTALVGRLVKCLEQMGKRVEIDCY